MRTVTRLLAAGLLLAACRVLSAAPGEKSVSVEFSLYAWGAGTAPLKYGSRQVVDGLDAFNRSDIHRYSGPATLDFFPANAPSPAPGGPPPAPAASVTLPEDVTKVSILATPSGRGRYRMYAIPEDGAAFPAQSIRFYNFTTSTLAVACGKSGHVELSPSASALVRLDGKAAVIQVARLHDGKWRRLFNNVAELNAEARQNVIFAPDDSGPVAMHTLPPWPLPMRQTEPAVAAAD